MCRNPGSKTRVTKEVREAELVGGGGRSHRVISVEIMGIGWVEELGNNEMQVGETRGKGGLVRRGCAGFDSLDSFNSC